MAHPSSDDQDHGDHDQTIASYVFLLPGAPPETQDGHRAFLEHASVFPQRSAGGESQCRAPQLVSSRSAAQTTEQRRAV
eukprot:gene13573-biopygen18567